MGRAIPGGPQCAISAFTSSIVASRNPWADWTCPRSHAVIRLPSCAMSSSFPSGGDISDDSSGGQVSGGCSPAAGGRQLTGTPEIGRLTVFCNRCRHQKALGNAMPDDVYYRQRKPIPRPARDGSIAERPKKSRFEGGPICEESHDHRGCHCLLDRDLRRRRNDRGGKRSEGSPSGKPVQGLRTGAARPCGAHFRGGRVRGGPPSTSLDAGSILFGMPSDRPLLLLKK